MVSRSRTRSFGPKPRRWRRWFRMRRGAAWWGSWPRAEQALRDRVVAVARQSRGDPGRGRRVHAARGAGAHHRAAGQRSRRPRGALAAGQGGGGAPACHLAVAGSGAGGDLPRGRIHDADREAHPPDRGGDPAVGRGGLQHRDPRRWTRGPGVPRTSPRLDARAPARARRTKGALVAPCVARAQDPAHRAQGGGRVCWPKVPSGRSPTSSAKWSRSCGPTASSCSG